MRKTVFNSLFLSVLLVGFFSALLFAGDEEFRFVNKINVDRDTALQASLISFKGDIKIHGIVYGSVLQIRGSLDLDGHVTADIIALGTDVNLSQNAQIDGEFLLIGGKLNRHDSAKIKGEFFFFKMSSKHFESSMLPVFLGSQAFTILKLIKILLWLLLTLIVYSMAPGRIHAMGILLQPDNWLRIVSNGIMTTSIGLVLLMVFVLLSFVIIGIPLLLLLAILGFVFLVISRTVMFYSCGGFFARAIKIKTKPTYHLVFGTVLYAVLKFIPVIGTVVLVLADLLGVGLIVTYYFRQRKRLN